MSTAKEGSFLDASSAALTAEIDRLRDEAAILHLHLGTAIGLLLRIQQHGWDNMTGIAAAGLITAENKRRYFGKDGELVAMPVVPTQAIIRALVDGNESWTGEEIWQRVLAAVKGKSDG